MNPTMDAIYILSAEAHIVDCLIADFDRRRYKRAYLVWTSLLDNKLRDRIDSSAAPGQIAGMGWFTMPQQADTDHSCI
jgi:syntaxin-binding protein 1